MSRMLQPNEIAKLFITVREHVISGDHHHMLRKHLTVEQMEKYSMYIEKLRKENK